MKIDKWFLGMLLIFSSCVELASAASQVALMDGLTGKLIVGYQGWFGCPNDFEGNKNWQHWFIKSVRPEFLTVDLLPSVREMESKDLCDTGLPRSDGQGTIKLFSSQNLNVVSTHFHWMRDYGIDGAAAQRFVVGLSDITKKKRSDHVLKNVKTAAENNGRGFFVAYDVSGAVPQTVVSDIRKDWQHLVRDLKLTQSSAYMRDQGKPILELWGFGFNNRPGEAEEVLALIEDLKNGRNGLGAATLIGGVPTSWRTLNGDSKNDAAWGQVYRSYDVISPWSVGRFVDEAGVDAFVRNFVVPDLAETQRLKLRYLPVISPGFSWYNLMTNRNNPTQAILNQTPRRCGQLLWKQVTSMLDARVDMLYAAMFDEVDEGTALFPTETRMDKLPVGANMLYLNQDGCVLPDDWYLRVTGEATKYLRRHEVPPVKIGEVLRP